MSDQSVSIARAMMVIALVAINCALMRETSWEIRASPAVWFALGIADYLILWKLILRRTFRAAHYAFLFVFVIAFLVLATQVAAERIHPMWPLVRWYHRITGEQDSMWLREISSIGDFWMAGVIGLLIAWVSALLAGWLERRRGWDIAAFCRGMLVGLGVANVFALAREWVWGSGYPGSPGFYANLVIIGACLILGGLLGLSKLKSNIRKII
jgi:hypothetical protein